jgi:hypothetical protein
MTITFHPTRFKSSRESDDHSIGYDHFVEADQKAPWKKAEIADE